MIFFFHTVKISYILKKKKKNEAHSLRRMIISQTQWQRRILKVFPRVTHICQSLFHSIFNLIATNGAYNPSFHYQEQSKKEQMATLQTLLSFLIFRMLSCTYVYKLRLPQATDAWLIQISEIVSVPYWYA